MVNTGDPEGRSTVEIELGLKDKASVIPDIVKYGGNKGITWYMPHAEDEAKMVVKNGSWQTLPDAELGEPEVRSYDENDQ